MMKPISFGRMGRAAFRVMAFCFAYEDELPPPREKSALCLLDDADLNDSPMIETGVGIVRLWGTVGKQQKTTQAPLLRATLPAQTGLIAICSSNVQSDRGQVGAFHG